MELWVRTQHKFALIKSSGIYLKEEHNDFADGSTNKWYFYDCSSREVIASYDSKERCLEILDEIQKLLIENSDPLVLIDSSIDDTDIQDGAIIECSPKEKVKVFQKSALVYEMPEK